jgi:hypothetical protein
VSNTAPWGKYKQGRITRRRNIEKPEFGPNCTWRLQAHLMLPKKRLIVRSEVRYEHLQELGLFL